MSKTIQIPEDLYYFTVMYAFSESEGNATDKDYSKLIQKWLDFDHTRDLRLKARDLYQRANIEPNMAKREALFEEYKKARLEYE